MNSSPKPGNLVGEKQRYRLERSLGEGGMGQVFLASDLRFPPPHKLVALKLLKERLIDNLSIRSRFDQEIRICARLSSNYIVKVTDSGVTPEGYPFYVMEYLQGQTLADVMKPERYLSPDRVIRIAIQICEGLRIAHEGFMYQEQLVSIVHRDLKPENIFLVESGMGELVKILDFGISKICSDIQTGGNLLGQTQQGTFLGTAHYASPEQIRGDQITTASDIYSLGVILYEMLSGTDPFDLRSEGTPKMSAWMKAHLSRSPIPLRDQSACRHLSPELEGVVMRCLEKFPDRRFPSVAALGEALQLPPPLLVSPVVPQTKNSSPLALMAIVGFLTIGVIGAVILLLSPKPPACTLQNDPTCYCSQNPSDPNCREDI